MKPVKIILLIFLITISISFGEEAKVEFYINERGRIISFYDQYFIYFVKGNLTIYNPSSAKLYDLNIPLALDGLEVLCEDNDEKAYFSNSNIYISILNPNSSKKFRYIIRGIITQNLLKQYNSLLETAIRLRNPRIYSTLKISLKKAPLENPKYTKRNARLISVRVENPSPFEFTIDSITVIKTKEMDPSKEISKWTFPNENDTKNKIKPYEVYEFDVIDTNAHEGEIYWLKSDIFLKGIEIVPHSNITLYTQDDLFKPEMNESEYLLNKTLAGLFMKRIFIRKYLSDNLAIPGKKINVTLLISNFEPQMIKVNISDSFPKGFVLSEKENFMKVNNNNVTVTNFEIPSKTIRRMRYELKYVDNESLGLDYFPIAILFYRNQTYYSQSIPFIRKYLPERKVFVQKKIDFLDDNRVKITLIIRNLGNEKIKDLIVKEYLTELDSFVEVSELPIEKGTWKIDLLNPGEEWEVSYVTDSKNIINYLPEVYGIPNLVIARTLILSNEIDNQIIVSKIQAIEIIGIISIGIILLLYFNPISIKRKKINDLIEMLRVTEQELKRLKDKIMEYENMRRSIEMHPKKEEVKQHVELIENKIKELSEREKLLLERKRMLEENLKLLQKLKKS